MAGAADDGMDGLTRSGIDGFARRQQSLRHRAAGERFTDIPFNAVGFAGLTTSRHGPQILVTVGRRISLPRYTIDRFEGTAWAVLEDEDAKTFLVPRRWLPMQAREGDVVIEAGQAPEADTMSLRLELDPSGRDERLAKAKRLREQLPSGPKGDISL